MGSWMDYKDRQLKKVVYGLTDATINKAIAAHESRGWERASEIKEYGYGLGCLMIYKKKEGA
jgi:hypothetical protein